MPGRRRRRSLLTWFTIGLILVSCSGSGTTTGVVVDVTGDLTDVESFTVLSDGEQHTFALLPDADYSFPPGHLRDHLRSGEPVTVGWEERDGTRVALSLEDA